MNHYDYGANKTKNKDTKQWGAPLYLRLFLNMTDQWACYNIILFPPPVATVGVTVATPAAATTAAATTAAATTAVTAATIASAATIAVIAATINVAKAAADIAVWAVSAGVEGGGAGAAAADRSAQAAQPPTYQVKEQRSTQWGGNHQHQQHLK